MNVFYLPRLKWLGLLYRNNNETVIWFIKALNYCCVYVPLLLSNDVETNPGPTLYDIIDVTTTVCADFSQSDRRFGQSAGKQCVAMSLTAIVHSQIENISTWNSCSLNNMLLNGNNLYTCISNSINKDLLLLSDVPEMIAAYDNIYNLQYSESYAGGIFMRCSNGPYLSLKDAFRNIFLSSELNYNYALLTIGCNTVAIFKIYDKFKIFDSHSRDSYGIPHPFGRCILLTIENIQNLVIFFQNVSSASDDHEDLEFEIEGVGISFNALEGMVVGASSADSNLNEVLSKSQCSVENVAKRQKFDQDIVQDKKRETREKRLLRQREYKRKIRENETAEKREKRLSNNRLYKRRILEDETPEERDERMLKNNKYIKKVLKNETPEKRQKKLASKRKRDKTNKNVISATKF